MKEENKIKKKSKSKAIKKASKKTNKKSNLKKESINWGLSSVMSRSSKPAQKPTKIKSDDNVFIDKVDSDFFAREDSRLLNETGDFQLRPQQTRREEVEPSLDTEPILDLERGLQNIQIERNEDDNTQGKITNPYSPSNDLYNQENKFNNYDTSSSSPYQSGNNNDPVNNTLGTYTTSEPSMNDVRNRSSNFGIVQGDTKGDKYDTNIKRAKDERNNPLQKKSLNSNF